MHSMIYESKQSAPSFESAPCFQDLPHLIQNYKFKGQLAGILACCFEIFVQWFVEPCSIKPWIASIKRFQSVGPWDVRVKGTEWWLWWSKWSVRCMLMLVEPKNRVLLLWRRQRAPPKRRLLRGSGICSARWTTRACRGWWRIAAIPGFIIIFASGGIGICHLTQDLPPWSVRARDSQARMWEKGFRFVERAQTN